MITTKSTECGLLLMNGMTDTCFGFVRTLYELNLLVFFITLLYLCMFKKRMDGVGTNNDDDNDESMTSESKKCIFEYIFV